MAHALPLQHARALGSQGRIGDALAALSSLLAGPPSPDRTAAAALFAMFIAEVRPSTWRPQFARDLLACFAEPIDHQPLARPTAALLLMQRGAPQGDAFWMAFLLHCINVDPAMEARIAALRAAAGDHHPPGWRAALALQAFANGYVLPPVDLGRDPLLAALDGPPTDRAALLALGDPIVDRLVRRAIAEPATERTLAARMPSLGPDHASSAPVRAHYEDAPYPRWQTPPTPARQSLAAALDTPVREVLVAGCGTGYEPIDFARTDPQVRVTAIDLSAASLAYGRRMAEALDVAVDFRRADLLHLEDWADRFDLVTSTGVLHHLADPLAGLRSLARVVRPSGMIRIALYSALARTPVAAARILIAASGWRPDLDGLRALRAHVLAASADIPLAALRDSDDCYSASGCRDLCFHAREHWYSLPDAGALVAAAGLELVGLDTPPAARAAFGRGDPLDLERWDALEAGHPALFAGMYQLWLRRPRVSLPRP